MTDMSNEKKRANRMNFILLCGALALGAAAIYLIFGAVGEGIYALYVLKVLITGNA